MVRQLMLILLIPFLVAASAVAQDTADFADPIAAELTKAKESYHAAVEKAKERLLTAFDDQRKKAQTNKRLKVEQKIKLVEQLEAEQRAFEDDSARLPESAELKVPVSTYRTAITTATQKCEAAFEKAAEAYGKRKDLDAAKAVLEEKTKFLADQEEGLGQWASLFNGKDLSGWRTLPGKAQWRVANGTIQGTGEGGWLIFDRFDVSDFQLRLEARIGDQGNSGVGFRATSTAPLQLIEAQINTNASSSVRTGNVGRWGSREDALVPVLAPNDDNPPPVGQWFQMEITARDNMISLAIDGKVRAKLIDTKTAYKKGRIALQPPGQGKLVEFRKLELRAIDSAK